MATYDLVIRGGTIVDGSGGEPFSAHIAIKGGVIAEIGQVSGAGEQEIEAAGMIVTPGFVDVHTHYDGQITWENRLAPSSDHGVTTVVMGNCGVGFAPVRPHQHELIVKLMEGVEDIPDVVMTSGVPWNWESFPDYLDAIEKRPSDIDFAAQLPHSPLRVYVMGERGASLEPPTESDLAEMRRLTAEAVRAGDRRLHLAQFRPPFSRRPLGAFRLDRRPGGAGLGAGPARRGRGRIPDAAQHQSGAPSSDEAAARGGAGLRTPGFLHLHADTDPAGRLEGHHAGPGGKRLRTANTSAGKSFHVPPGPCWAWSSRSILSR